MSQNNSLNQYSEYFSIGPNAKGTAASTFPLAVQEDANSPSGITVKNATDGTDSAAATNYQTASGTVHGQIGTYSPNYTTSPNLAGRTVISSAGTSSDGIAVRYNTGENLLVLNADTKAATFDSDGVMTEHVAVKVGDDVDSEDVEFTVADGSTGIKTIQSRDDRNSLTSCTIYNKYDNGTMSGARVTVGTGVPVGDSGAGYIGGGIGAHSPGYTSVNNFAGRVNLYCDSGADGLGMNFSATQNFVMGRGADTSKFMVMTGSGERTMPLNPCFLAYNSVIDSNVTGNSITAKIEFDAEVFDQGSNFDTTTDTFTAPVTGRYEFIVSIYLKDLASTHTAFILDCITSNRSHRLLTTGAYDLRAKDTSDGNYNTRASFIADMDAGDTAYINVKIVGGAQTVDVNGSVLLSTSFQGNLIS